MQNFSAGSTGRSQGSSSRGLPAQSSRSSESATNRRRAPDLQELDPDYKLRASAFFIVGRVLQALWTEPAGETRDSGRVNGDLLPTRYAGEIAFSKIRWFVVSQMRHGFSIVLPITTYGGRGVGKPGAKKSDHAVIYTGSSEPPTTIEEQPGPTEQPMRSPSIRVVPDNARGEMDVMSRLDFGKYYTLHHNQKVKAFGNVHPNSMQAFQSHFSAVLGPVGESQPAVQQWRPSQTPYDTAEERYTTSRVQDPGVGSSRQNESYRSRGQPTSQQSSEEAEPRTMAAALTMQARATVVRLQTEGYQLQDAVEEVVSHLQQRLGVSKEVAMQYLRS